MSITHTPQRRVPPTNPHPHLAVKPDPTDPGRYVESVVYDVATGERFVRFPVDAREMVASGKFTHDPPADPEPAA